MPVSQLDDSNLWLTLLLLFNAFGRCFKYSKEITDITTNDPKDESLACVSQFVGIYEDFSMLDRPFFPKCDRHIISAWQQLSNSTERSV
ncbi:hypothetical protein [Microcoleus sp. D2_18a_B4]|uniref:hypothetical protein n=1 Tax=Microcoleus sp. D2_18a_B4 TaxID=3055329 RepID=UPI002FD2F4A1